MSDLQPGLGIPTSIVDAALQRSAPVGPDGLTDQDRAVLAAGGTDPHPELPPYAAGPGDSAPPYAADGPAPGVSAFSNGPQGDLTPQDQAVLSATDEKPQSAVKVAPHLSRSGIPELDEMEARQMGTAQADTDRVGQAIAQQAQETKDHYKWEADFAKMRSDLELSWANADKKASSEAAAESAKYISAYKEQIAAVRKMSVDPTGPIASLSAGEAGGLSLAMFAQGFLAARGIHIDVGGQIDRWVDRSIHEQERRIQQKEASANDQLHLWEIAKQTSRDAQEARQRYRGFITAALQSQVEQHTALYQSDLANSQGAEKVARLQMEADNTSRGIETSHYQLVHQDRMDRATIAHMAAEDALLEAQRQKALAEAQAKPTNRDGHLVPIKDIDDGKAKWYVDASTPEGRAAAKELREQSENDKIMLDTLKDLKLKYQDAYGAAQNSDNWDHGGVRGALGSLVGGTAPLITGTPGAALNDKVRAFQRAQEKATIVLATYGRVKRFNKDEMESFKKQMPGESGWQVGSNGQAIDDLMEQVRQKNEAAIGTYATGTVSGQPEEVSPRLKANYIISTTSAEEHPAVQDAVRTDLDKAAGPRPEPEEAVKTSAAWSTLGGKKAFGGHSTEGKMPAAFLGVELLALAKMDPGEFRKYAGGNAPDSDQVLSAQADIALQQLANDTSKPAHDYARTILQEIERNPEMWRTILVSDSASGDLGKPQE